MKYRFGVVAVESIEALRALIGSYLENELTNGPGFQVYDESDRLYAMDVEIQVVLKMDCPRCEGTGEVWFGKRGGQRPYDQKVRCPSCFGRKTVEIKEEPEWLGRAS